MSTDAFAASIGKGASLSSPRFINALKLGLIFGCIEAIAPIIGWLIGSAGAGYIQAWDHWLAFILLVGLGGYMLLESTKSNVDEPVELSKKRTLMATLITAVGTSLDAMTVGISLAFLDVNIYIAAAMIGLATTTMVTIGSLLGNSLGKIIGNKAEAFGGLALIAIGIWIPYSHIYG